MITQSVGQKLEVPFVDLKAQWRGLSQEILPGMQRVLDNASYILSPDVHQFEEAFAAYNGTRYAVGVASGTDAIILALNACGIGYGDEVLVPAYTYVATIAAICHRGARPIFVDIDERTFLMDVADMKAKRTARTRAVVPVHLYGRVMDIRPWLPWAKEHGLRVVEDAAQAHGAEVGGHKAGTMGDVGCFSFYPGKNLGCYGDGGAIVTNDKEIADTIARLRNQGQSSKYVHPLIGYNSRLDSLQAVVLNVKLRHLPEWNRLRHQNAVAYNEKLAGISGVKCPAWDQTKPKGHVFHVYTVRTARRDGLIEHLKSNGVAAQLHYPTPVHLQEGFANLGFSRGDLPVSERVASEILSLPMYPELDSEKIGYVSQQIQAFFSN